MGTVADYIGRKAAININILIYSISAGLMFFVHSLGFFIVLRIIAGLGLGGQWGNSMTLIAESVPDNYRGRAVAIGNVSWPIGTLLAAVFAFLIYPHVGWRVTFAIAAFPALFVFYVLKFVPESAMWKEKRAEIISSRKSHVPYLTIFNRAYIKTTLLILITMMFTMFSYWMFWTWLPTYLIKAHGFNLSKTSTWLIVSQVGAFCGYLFNGWIQDKIGRRVAVSSFLFLYAIATFVFLALVGNYSYVYVIIFFVGLFTGFYAAFGAVICENFSTEIRSTGTGFTYNLARGTSLIGPPLIVYVATRISWNVALTLPGVCAILAGLLIWILRETRCCSLVDVGKGSV